MPKPKFEEAYRSLSPDELHKLWRLSPRTRGQPPPRVVEYDEIIRARSIDDVFRGGNSLIIFYPAVEYNGFLMGHYVSLIKGSPNTLYFCDSYGDIPDSQKENTDPKLYSKEKNNSLLRLFLDSGYDVDYSNHKLQFGGKVATCGRWSLWRCENADLTNDQFAQLARFAAKQLGQTLDDTAVSLWSGVSPPYPHP